MLDIKKIPRLDLEALYTFAIVAEHESFSTAAELMCKTTSAISYRIKALEDSMGVALVKRTTRSVSLTPSGEVLLEKANKIFEWYQCLPNELQQVRDGIEPTFTIVINNLLYHNHGPAAARLLAHLHNKFPTTTFKIFRSVYMGVWDAMIHGGGDLAIGAPGHHTISDELKAEPLGIINWTLVCSTDHPLVRDEKPLSMESIRNYPVINIEDTSIRLQKRMPWRLTGQQEIIVPDMKTKISCHIEGLGVGFLPDFIAKREIAAGHLVEVSVSNVVRSPSPFSIVSTVTSPGKISQYIQKLIYEKSELVSPFLEMLTPNHQLE